MDNLGKSVAISKLCFPKNTASNTLGNVKRLFCTGEIRQEDRKLIPTKPGYESLAADRALQALCDREKHFVAKQVPKVVVNELEVIEV